MLGGINELRMGLNRQRVRLLRPHAEVPTLRSGDGVRLPGSEAAADYYFRDTVFHVAGTHHRLVNRHAFTFGLEWRPLLHDSLLSPARDGVYGFASIEQFLADLPESLSITINRQTGLPAENAAFWRYYWQNESAALIQDNWKVTPRLTVNLGLRWETFGAPLTRKRTEDLNFVFGPGDTPAERIAGGRMQTTELYRPDRNNVAPRVGFALDISGIGRTVLRGGYGVFFDRVFNNFWMDSRSNNLPLLTLTNVSGSPARFQYAFPARSAIPATASVAPASVVAVDQNLRTPYTQSWFLGFQHEVTADILIEVSHTGALGRKLAASDIINRKYALPVTAGNPEGRFNAGQPDIHFRSNQGHSDNVALQLAVNRRWNSGLQFQTSYSYARSRDVQTSPYRRASWEWRQRPSDLSFASLQASSSFVRQMDPGADYGYSDYDQRHNLVFNFTAQAPLLRGVPRLMSGWQVSALAGFRSGLPFSTITRQAAISDPGSVYIEPGSGLLIDNRLDFLGVRPREGILETSDSHRRRRCFN